MQKPHINPGLLELPEDGRDFVHEKVFGSIKPDFPKSLVVCTPNVRDQGETDFCTSFAVAAVSEDQEGVLLDPVFLFHKTRLIDGKPIETYGANLRDACKAAVKYGIVAEEYATYTDLDVMENRDFLADPKNWDASLDVLAWEHAKNSFFRVDQGSFDTFDNIRMALMMNQRYQRSVVTGCDWYDSWTQTLYGVISEDEPKGCVGGHAFKVFGFVEIEGKEYLAAQLSNGKGIGDEGVFYLPRSIVNKYFVYGAFMFTDLPKNKAALYMEAGIKVTDKPFKRIWKTLQAILKFIV